MSSPRRPENSDASLAGPYVGSRLRIPANAIRARVLAEVNAAGFDLAPAHLNVFQYPRPDELRPIELAAKAHMSKQAMNYLIVQLEARGYLERRSVRGKGRLVFLTAAGHRLYEFALAASGRIEAELQKAIGAKRWSEFRAVLDEVGDITGTFVSDDVSCVPGANQS